MVFVTLELNEKMNYIHIQLKRDEVSQGMEIAVGCMYFKKKKKEEISVLLEVFVRWYELDLLIESLSCNTVILPQP